MSAANDNDNKKPDGTEYGPNENEEFSNIRAGITRAWYGACDCGDDTQQMHQHKHCSKCGGPLPLITIDVVPAPDQQ